MRHKLIFSFILLILFKISPCYSFDDREINDTEYKFTFLLPSNWSKTDVKETNDRDAISYSFERNDKKCAIMVLAFKLTTVKNLEDFIYTMEKEATLNIPKRAEDFKSFDTENFDGKSAIYKDAQYTENIFFFRTKLPDAPFNYVYMLRFITANEFVNNDMSGEIKKISDSFLPTVK